MIDKLFLIDEQTDYLKACVHLFWWLKGEDLVHDPLATLRGVMARGSIRDWREMERLFPKQMIIDTLENAVCGDFLKWSWDFWRLRYGLPEKPLPSRFPDMPPPSGRPWYEAFQESPPEDPCLWEDKLQDGTGEIRETPEGEFVKILPTGEHTPVTFPDDILALKIRIIGVRARVKDYTDIAELLANSLSLRDGLVRAFSQFGLPPAIAIRELTDFSKPELPSLPKEAREQIAKACAELDFPGLDKEEQKLPEKISSDEKLFPKEEFPLTGELSPEQLQILPTQNRSVPELLCDIQLSMERLLSLFDGQTRESFLKKESWMSQDAASYLLIIIGEAFSILSRRHPDFCKKHKKLLSNEFVNFCRKLVNDDAKADLGAGEVWDRSHDAIPQLLDKVSRLKDIEKKRATSSKPRSHM